MSLRFQLFSNVSLPNIQKSQNQKTQTRKNHRIKKYQNQKNLNCKESNSPKTQNTKLWKFTKIPKNQSLETCLVPALRLIRVMPPRLPAPWMATLVDNPEPWRPRSQTTALGSCAPKTMQGVRYLIAIQRVEHCNHVAMPLKRVRSAASKCKRLKAQRCR